MGILEATMMADMTQRHYAQRPCHIRLRSLLVFKGGIVFTGTDGGIHRVAGQILR